MHSDIADIDYLDRGECDGMAVRKIEHSLRGQNRAKTVVASPLRSDSIPQGDHDS